MTLTTLPSCNHILAGEVACSNMARGLVDDVDDVPAHFCRQCSHEHCAMRRHLAERGHQLACLDIVPPSLQHLYRDEVSAIPPQRE